jgi:hypothetical protein
MKKAIAIALASLMLFLCGCSAKSEPDNNALIELHNISVDSSGYEIDLGSAQKVNRLMLEGSKLGEITIEIYDEQSNLIYKQQNSSDERFCAFDTVYSSRLKLVVSNSSAKFSSISAYYDTYETQSFRVVSYVVADRILDKANLNAESFDIITDVILFSCVSFDENGKLFLNGFEDMDGETYLAAALANLREAIGSRNVRIHLNILGPNANEGMDDWNKQMANKAEKHSTAFAKGTLPEQIKALAEKTGVDGIFFDYEYPIKQKYWNDFSSFLVELDETMPDKTIGLALADWDAKLDKKAINAVDMVEMMEYDLFDENGDHSSFETAKCGIDKFLKKGYEKSKLDLGVPFYGRPVDKGGYWYNYKDYSKALGRYENKGFSDEQNIDAYFDSYQRVYDKTALALECGLGGMMVWHYTCDDFETPELSLFGAMKNCIENRT